MNKTEKLYIEGEYLKNNPSWHAEDSSWKAVQIVKLLDRNKIEPNSICEVGCGVGEILSQLQKKLGKKVEFWGYEISPQAYEICKNKENSKLHFALRDILKEGSATCEVMLLIDLIEHLEDYYDFLRKIKDKSQFKILHIPLDLSAQGVLRKTPLLRSRKLAGHLHYFNKELALQLLKDLEYKILDVVYTSGATDLPARSVVSFISKLPRKILYYFNQDFAVRLLGGYSLLVLVK
ncbi:MAG: class I SAM-dependent methyltransferase [Candidatus Margulisbacteria bacterium]|nr:class I SAM-dependent methyltransferase [Candidatus Margulisiibacteriota bacterium]MBU1022124.1 class I SAM-dependent methyltransferase [Candidatus Margulisiibacteriota bacterium]MBU1728640.1 class I SAM-dependent methyltransferase [Candidatus Margulisiibacteriota bacterium]MBU1955091.1 class I SAM-dependent methyltransferase [Candidatus Margulisiibacteriota bacterium]